MWCLLWDWTAGILTTKIGLAPKELDVSRKTEESVDLTTSQDVAAHFQAAILNSSDLGPTVGTAGRQFTFGILAISTTLLYSNLFQQPSTR